MKPPTPVDELLRLETLRNLKILDTNPEERFDRVTRLARRVFGTPIALVSLVDAERQWFKSRQGLDATETPRDISFCGHAVLEDETMVVSDAANDDRFCDNPLVTSDPNIRFYAGYPLSAPNGSKVGTLCIIDREPREMSAEDKEMLEEFGRMIEEELVVAEMLRDDPVTGLANGAGFAQIAGHVLAMCDRTKSAASLVLGRFVNHSVIEHTFSREQADRSVIELAQHLLSNFRNSDIVARISDDMFAVLLAGSRFEEIDSALERLAARVEVRNADCDDADEIEMATSAVEYRPGRHANIDELISDAENQMGVHESPTIEAVALSGDEAEIA